MRQTIIAISVHHACIEIGRRWLAAQQLKEQL